YVAKEHGRNRVVIARGGDRFEILERCGNQADEVKARMGLAGDNSPLEAPQARTSGARAQLGETIGALASGLSEAAGEDSNRARVVDSVVREATDYLTRNLSARLAEEADKP